MTLTLTFILDLCQVCIPLYWASVKCTYLYTRPLSSVLTFILGLCQLYIWQSKASVGLLFKSITNVCAGTVYVIFAVEI